VFIMTKSGATAQAAKVAERLIRPGGILVTLQNGIGNHAVLAKHFPSHAVVAGVTTEGARMERAGLVSHTGHGDTLIAGSGNEEAASVVTTLLSLAGFQCTQINEQRAMDSVVWGKLLINCAINPITAIMNVPNGSLLHSQEARDMMSGTSLC